MAAYYFQTKNLAVGYDGQTLIRDITIGVEKGEIVTLIGPNGAGKSTILKSITRQLKTIAGTVTIDRADLKRLSLKELATRMAVVLTERIKPELMTCRDIVATGRYPYTGRLGLLTGEDEAQIDEAMRRVHALELSDRDFNTISDGQRQRILLARAICQEPEIIILDEPTKGVDVGSKAQIYEIMSDLASKGMAILMISSEMPEVINMSDRIYVMSEGKISAEFNAKGVTQDAILKAAMPKSKE